MPAPGETRAAALRAGFHDPALAVLEGPVARGCDRVAALAERLRDLSIRQALAMSFGAVVAMLALLAWMAGT